MTFTLRTLSCFAASAAVLLGTSTSGAANPRAGSVRSVGSAELHMQVLLDRAGFSPGEIDGSDGQNTRKALAAFQASRGLTPGPRGRKAVFAALGAGAVESIVSYTITAEDAAGPFIETIPADMTEQSTLPGLYYTSLLEALGEKFHSSPTLLKRLNPGRRFAAGARIRVPNVSVTEHAAPAGMVTVVVSKSASTLTVLDRKGETVFHAPVTSGSEHDSLPLGHWEVTSVSRRPTFSYNPDLFWDADPASVKATIPAGPNNPAGVVWIDINKPHYGLHGGPDPGRIGYSASHGCVRLTNWDAASLAALVARGTPVLFEQ